MLFLRLCLQSEKSDELLQAHAKCNSIALSHCSSGSRIDNAAAQKCATAICDADDAETCCKVRCMLLVHLVRNAARAYLR